MPLSISGQSILYVIVTFKLVLDQNKCQEMSDCGYIINFFFTLSEVELKETGLQTTNQFKVDG